MCVCNVSVFIRAISSLLKFLSVLDYDFVDVLLKCASCILLFKIYIQSIYCEV